MTKYILERQGWGQWYDDGGCWQRNRDVARKFDSRDDADAVAIRLNLEFGDDCDDVRVVEIDD